MSNGLHRRCVQQVGPTLGCSRNRATIEQEQVFDPAAGSGVYNLLDIRRGVARSDLLVESPQGLKCRPGGYLRIPKDGDQRSELMSITIPK